VVEKKANKVQLEVLKKKTKEKKKLVSDTNGNQKRNDQVKTVQRLARGWTTSDGKKRVVRKWQIIQWAASGRAGGEAQREFWAS